MIIQHDGTPLDLTADHIPDLLAHHGLTITQVAEDSGDPTDLPARIRQNLAAAATRTPIRYRSAIPTVEAVRTWVDDVIGQSKAARAIDARRIVEGPSLLLLGPTGVGKTYEAHGALRLLGASGVYGTIRAVGTADLYADVRPSGGGTEAFERYVKAPVLFLDDLGAAKPSEWTEEITYRLVNQRYEAMLPTLFTSNVPPAKLGEVLGERVASRLTEMCRRTSIKAQDRRKGGGV